VTKESEHFSPNILLLHATAVALHAFFGVLLFFFFYLILRTLMVRSILKAQALHMPLSEHSVNDWKIMVT